MKKLTSTLLIIFMAITNLEAQENLGYQTPPASIMQLADYQKAPAVAMDSKKEYMLLSYRSTYKTLDDLSQQEISLGGLRINPVTNIGSTTSYINNLKLRKVKDAEPIQVKGLPTHPKIAFVNWSPDETKIAFTHTTESGVELWVLDVATAQATQLTEPNVNAN